MLELLNAYRPGCIIDLWGFWLADHWLILVIFCRGKKGENIVYFNVVGVQLYTGHRTFRDVKCQVRLYTFPAFMIVLFI